MGRAARWWGLNVCTTTLAAAAVLAMPAAATAPKVVPVGDNYFGQDGHIHGVGTTRGTVVRWIWTGEDRHNVTVLSGPERFRSSTQRRGTFEHRMRRRGRYTIVCTIHGRQDQAMTLVVR